MSVEKVYADLSGILAEVGALSPETIVPTAIKMVAVLNNVAGMSGAEKKALVLKTLDHATWGDETVHGILQTVLPSAIDTAVAIGRGKIDLRRPETVVAAVAEVAANVDVEVVEAVKTGCLWLSLCAAKPKQS